LETTIPTVALGGQVPSWLQHSAKNTISKL
jgi:hypothetical protein